jgi:methylthioribose-1-phosphate isomerase
MRAVEWRDGSLMILDQTRLPRALEWLECRDVPSVCRAISVLAVRGAPAIGVAAAYGMALSKDAASDAKALKASRPTAVDLEHAVDFVLQESRQGRSALDSARLWDRRNSEKCRAISANGAGLLKSGDSVLTHCNTGFLATNEYGSALGAVKAAHAQGKEVFVYVDETRPRQQGALTSWELLQEKIPHKVIVDAAAGSLMRQGKINAVMVGADRIAKNGDFANKIGTYPAAVLAHENKVPFYVLAPASTFDGSIADGSGITIEYRDESEVLGDRFPGASALNPAFDITPSKYVTAFVNESGVFRRVGDLWKSMKE